MAQAGEIKTRSFELETSRTPPYDFELLAKYGYESSNRAASFGHLLRHNMSAWTTKTFDVADGATLRLGDSVRYKGEKVGQRHLHGDHRQRPLVDALIELAWDRFRFAANATNLVGKKFLASRLGARR